MVRMLCDMLAIAAIALTLHLTINASKCLTSPQCPEGCIRSENSKNTHMTCYKRIFKKALTEDHCLVAQMIKRAVYTVSKLIKHNMFWAAYLVSVYHGTLTHLFTCRFFFFYIQSGKMRSKFKWLQQSHSENSGESENRPMESWLLVIRLASALCHGQKLQVAKDT